MKTGDTMVSEEADQDLAVDPAPAAVSSPPVMARKRSSARKWLGGVALVAALVGGYAVWSQEQPKQGTGAASAPAPQAVPVVTAPVVVKDMPIYLTGIGTAQPSQSVTLKVRVDGQLTKIGFTEGAIVNKGDLIAQIDPRTFQAQLEQATAQKAKDEALLENAKDDLERFSTLLKSDYTSRKSFDTQKSLVAQYGAALQSDQATIDYQKTQLSFTTITAPVTGVAGIRLLDEGNIVRATDASGIVVINQIEPISSIFTVPQDALDAVRNAMANGEVKVLASARTDTSTRAEGKLVVIDNQIDQATGNLHIKADFPNTKRTLWPGQFLNFKVLVETRKDALTIPATAVQRGPQGTFVYIVKADSTAEVKPVTIVQSVDGVAIIGKGIEPGTTVVSDGQYKLKPGIKVTAQNAKTAANETAANEAPGAEIKR